MDGCGGVQREDDAGDEEDDEVVDGRCAREDGLDFGGGDLLELGLDYYNCCVSIIFLVGVWRFRGPNRFVLRR